MAARNLQAVGGVLQLGPETREDEIQTEGELKVHVAITDEACYVQQRWRRVAGDRLEIKPRAEWLLQELGLWEVRHGQVGSFSRGMQQKVAIAAALITDPPILLLDEPTLGLDVEAARTVRDWIARLAREQGKTILLTTDQLDVAQKLCDRIAIMRRGQVATDLPVPELLARFRQDRYQITLDGVLDSHRVRLAEGTKVSQDDGATTLVAPAGDPQDLYALLGQLRDLDLPLRSVRQVEPDLEEVFLQVVREA